MPERAVGNRRRGGFSIARIAQTPVFLNATAATIAAGLRFINATTRVHYEPRDPVAVFTELAPMIVTAWHGQAFMLPFLRPPAFDVDVLASRHADGEVIARTLRHLGCGVIRGSGAPNPAAMHKKGAVAGFRGMVTALAEGRSVALTADFLKNARRKVGPGIIALARMSGRPIVPTAFVSSRRRQIGSSWDRTTISLPFAHAACVIADPVWVPRDADEAEVDRKRQELEDALNAVAVRAETLADGRRG